MAPPRERRREEPRRLFFFFFFSFLVSNAAEVFDSNASGSSPPPPPLPPQPLHLPSHLSSPCVSPPAPPGEIRGGFLDRGTERSATNFLKKKKKTSKLRERFQLARRIDRNSLSPPLHSCIFPHGKREKKNNKNLRAKSLSATLVPASISASAEH